MSYEPPIDHEALSSFLFKEKIEELQGRPLFENKLSFLDACDRQLIHRATLDRVLSGRNAPQRSTIRVLRAGVEKKLDHEKISADSRERLLKRFEEAICHVAASTKTKNPVLQRKLTLPQKTAQEVLKNMGMTDEMVATLEQPYKAQAAFDYLDRKCIAGIPAQQLEAYARSNPSPLKLALLTLAKQ